MIIFPHRVAAKLATVKTNMYATIQIKKKSTIMVLEIIRFGMKAVVIRIRAVVINIINDNSIIPPIVLVTNIVERLSGIEHMKSELCLLKTNPKRVMETTIGMTYIPSIVTIDTLLIVRLTKS